MKKLLLIIICLLFSTNAWATNWCNDANTEMCYTFDDGSGTTLTDSSVNNRDGTITDATWESISGTNYPTYVNYNLDCDGYRDYVTISNASFTDKVSVCAWIREKTTDTNSDNYVSFHPGFFISGNTSSGTVRFAITTSSEVSVNFDTIANIGTTWHHYCGVYNGSTIKTYLDGVEKSTGSQSGNIDLSGSTRVCSYWNSSNYDADIEITNIIILSKEISSIEVNDIMTNGLVQSVSSQPTPTQTELRNVTLRNVTIR